LRHLWLLFVNHADRADDAGLSGFFGLLYSSTARHATVLAQLNKFFSGWMKVVF
jgi:hypothetical protein